MNGYERRTELKKDKVRNAALELFSTYGTDKTSINDIAKKAGVAPASIYNYFGSKDGLLKVTAKNLLEDSFKEKERLWESDQPFSELIKHALSIKNNFIEQTNQEFLKEIITTDPEIKTLVDDFYVNKYPSIIEKFIEKGRSEGYIRKELSIKAAMLYLKMYQNFIQQESELLTNETVILKELFDLMLYGLAGQPIHD